MGKQPLSHLGDSEGPNEEGGHAKTRHDGQHRCAFHCMGGILGCVVTGVIIPNSCGVKHAQSAPNGASSKSECFRFEGDVCIAKNSFYCLIELQ